METAASEAVAPPVGVAPPGCEARGGARAARAARAQASRPTGSGAHVSTHAVVGQNNLQPLQLVAFACELEECGLAA